MRAEWLTAVVSGGNSCQAGWLECMFVGETACSGAWHLVFMEDASSIVAELYVFRCMAPCAWLWAVRPGAEITHCIHSPRNWPP